MQGNFLVKPTADQDEAAQSHSGGYVPQVRQAGRLLLRLQRGNHVFYLETLHARVSFGISIMKDATIF